jgi:hypothetical protein
MTFGHADDLVFELATNRIATPRVQLESALRLEFCAGRGSGVAQEPPLSRRSVECFWGNVFPFTPQRLSDRLATLPSTTRSDTSEQVPWLSL